MAGKPRPTYEERMRQAHQMCLWEVQGEIERLERELAVLVEKQEKARVLLLAAEMEIDFTWMVEN